MSSFSAPLCRHFGVCGGCTYQDMPDDAYAAMKRESVMQALAAQGLNVDRVVPLVRIAPQTRRRAALKAAKADGVVRLGFHAAATHDIVDMQECRLLTQSLLACVPRLRTLLTALLQDGDKAELSLTETEGGPDLAISWKHALTPRLFARVADLARNSGVARITAKGEIVLAFAAPVAALGTARVTLPPGAFLQPTRSGEGVLQSAVGDALKGAKSVADLFSGCGTFALVLARSMRVHAVELDRPALAALADAVRTTQGLKPVTTESRNLFRQPLGAGELARFDGVVLDPPRAGANAQIRELAQARVPRIAYVSCNPVSFARDARVLTDAGFRLGQVTAVDQFLWSSHIELVAVFSRD
jgi:23S rRNA (uracil1939-C5)-methyltransferase